MAAKLTIDKIVSNDAPKGLRTLGANKYAFYANGSGNADAYAVGKATHFQNVWGNNAASNFIVAGKENAEIHGGAKNDIIIAGAGNNIIYGEGGNDILISTKGEDTLVAGKETSTLDQTFLIGGTGTNTLTGGLGSSVFLVGSNNTRIDGGDQSAKNYKANGVDTLSFAAIGTVYYKGYNHLKITVNLDPKIAYAGTATITYVKSDGSTATLAVDKFTDIQNIVGGSAELIVNANGNSQQMGIDPGVTGGPAATYNTTTGLYDPAPATGQILGTAGNDTLFGGSGGGNVNYDGGAGSNNTLDFSGTLPGQNAYADCIDIPGLHFSIILDLASEKYSYQQQSGGATYVWGGSVKNIQSVTGSLDCNDIISGNATAQTLVGGGGNGNILYGGGGYDKTTLRGSTLYGSTNWNNQANGNDGYNWVVFQRPSDLMVGGQNNGEGSTTGNPYYRNGLGVDANLDPTYSFMSADGLVQGDMIGFANILGTTGNDTLTGDTNNNVLVGGAGDDIISGRSGSDASGGNDVLYGGSGINRLLGGAKTSASIDTFVSGYNYNPVAAQAYTPTGYDPATLSLRPETSTENNIDGEVFANNGVDNLGPTPMIVSTSTSAASDTILDWHNADELFVSSVGSVYIEGVQDYVDGSFALHLASSDASSSIDISSAQNLGKVYIAVGNGNNRITGSSGRDYIVAGNGANTINDYLDFNLAVSNESAPQTITAGNGGNAIHVGDDEYIIHAGSGNDTIQAGNGNNIIRADDGRNVITAGNGDNIIATGSGADTITVGTGKNDIYAGGGLNVINLGGTSETHENRIFVNQISSKDDITGFISGVDKILIDRYMLTKSGITPGNRTFSYDPNLSSNDSVDAGQAFGIGRVEKPDGFSFTGAVYQAAYNSVLYVTGDDLYSSPIGNWTNPSNGAFTNADHHYAYGSGVAAGSGLAYGTYALGVSLAFIPFVGPLIAAPVLAIAGVMGYELSPAGGTLEHINPEYNSFDQGLLGTDMKTLGANIASDWTKTTFTSFFNAPNDGFVPSLEISGVFGPIQTVALLHDGTTKTYVYLVNSPDNLIQNNEAILIAQVNGYVNASDLDLFDSSQAEFQPYAGTASGGPVRPATATISILQGDNTGIVVTDPSNVNLAKTKDSTPRLRISFDKALAANDRVVIRDGGTTLLTLTAGLSRDATHFEVGDTNAGFDLSGSAGKTYALSVTVENDVTATESTPFVLDVDLDAPKLTINATTAGIQFSLNETGTVRGLDSNLDPVSIDGTHTEYTLGADVAFASLVTPAAQPDPTWITSYWGSDVLGNVQTFEIGLDSEDGAGLPAIGFGTNGNDVLDASSINANTAIYGFSGNDTITGGVGRDTISGGAGNDVLSGNAGADIIDGGIGNDILSGGAGDDILIGGAGENTISGGAGSDTAAYVSASSAVTVDLSLLTAQDTLGAGIDTLASIENLTGSDFSDTLIGDSFANTIDGGLGNDVLTAGDGNDILIGGAGNDALNGGGGNDTVSYVGASVGVTVDLRISTSQDTTGAGLDTLSSIENLTGSDFNDTLIGDASHNLLDGSLGNDTLTGGAGSDTFVFSTAFDGIKNVDDITDFSSADGDKIALKLSVFDALANDTLANSIDSGLLSYDCASGGLFYDKDGTAGAGDPVLFAYLSNKPVSVSASDFILV